MSTTRHHYSATTYAHYNLKVAFCHSCGYAHRTELPTEAELDAYYGDNDAFYADRDWLAKEQAEHEAGLWDRAYQYRLAQLYQFHTPIIDVGCSSGHFVDYCLRRGVTAYGIEPSPSARNLALYPNMIYPSLEELGPVKGNIHLSLVLEHVLDPGDLIRDLVSHMWPGGRLLIMVPNEFNPLQRRLSHQYGHWYIQWPHLNYFTPASLTHLCAKYGLILINEGATFPTETFATVFRQPYIGNDAVGRRCHRARLAFEKRFPFAYQLYSFLHRRLSWGRELLYTFELQR